MTNSKKLVLRRRTVRELTAGELKGVEGGLGSARLTQSTCHGLSAGCNTNTETSLDCGTVGVGSDMSCNISQTTYGC